MKGIVISGCVAMLCLIGLSLPDSAAADRGVYRAPVYGGASVSAKIGDVRVAFGVPVVVPVRHHVAYHPVYRQPCRPLVVHNHGWYRHHDRGYHRGWDHGRGHGHGQGWDRHGSRYDDRGHGGRGRR